MLKRSRQELSKNSDSSLLLRDIQKVKSELDCAYSNFENAVEPDLIDCYIYQLKSAQMRYKFLLNRAKQAELQKKRRDVAHN